LNKKLNWLSKQQKRPLLNVKNTVICYNLDKHPPQYVIDTLALGPKNSIVDKFNRNEVLAELDGLLRFCKDNVKTLAYIKNCQKQKPTRNILLTKKYLRENNLLAVPFDKGIGICVMSVESYTSKLKTIIDLPQFQKMVPKRKNEKHPVLKEEERIVSALKRLRNDEQIEESLFDKLKPLGSQAPRIYGLAKVHKKDIPVRPVLSMPGSAYHRIANQVADWLKVLQRL